MNEKEISEIPPPVSAGQERHLPHPRMLCQ